MSIQATPVSPLLQAPTAQQPTAQANTITANAPATTPTPLANTDTTNSGNATSFNLPAASTQQLDTLLGDMVQCLEGLLSVLQKDLGGQAGAAQAGGAQPSGGAGPSSTDASSASSPSDGSTPASSTDSSSASSASDASTASSKDCGCDCGCDCNCKSDSASAPSGGGAPDSSAANGPTSPPIYILGNAQFSNGGSIRAFANEALQFPASQGIGGTRDPNAAAAFQKLLASNSPDLDTPLPDGQSALVSADGKLMGFVPTTQVMSDNSLKMSGHTVEQIDDSVGGSITDTNGKTQNVAATLLSSPIVLDLSGTGKITTTGVSTSEHRKNLAGDKIGKTVSFDIDGDGKKDNVEWTTPGNAEGILVDDRDGGATKAMNTNGQIDGSRLFGDQGGKYANGYQKLAQLDTNHDGKLTGHELDGLKVWVNTEGDGIVHKGELKSLSQLGITEMDVNSHQETNARGESLTRSSFVMNGKQQADEDVWFAKKQ